MWLQYRSRSDCDVVYQRQRIERGTDGASPLLAER
jgi:hypothetical protein